MDYIKNPAAIYEKSFALIKQEADLSAFNDSEGEVVIRLIHACGMVDIVDDLVFSDGAIKIGRAALTSGTPIICDVKMVAKGIIKRKLKYQNQILCGLDGAGANEFALKNNTTRTVGGVEILREQIDGAIIAIGNAPTALFHLLEMVEKGLVKPALILGFPVGFVGAVESKQALIENKLGVEFIALRGRRGGSAYAASCVNALAAGLAI